MEIIYKLLTEKKFWLGLISFAIAIGSMTGYIELEVAISIIAALLGVEIEGKAYQSAKIK